MRTLMIIMALVLVASAVYFMDTGTYPWEAQDLKSPVYFQEDNGVLGRMFEYTMDLTWNPAMFAVSSLGFLLGSAGLVVYWRSIDD